MTDLLAGIPEALWDKPQPKLGGQTPREAAAHFDETGCRMCHWGLAEMREAA